MFDSAPSSTVNVQPATDAPTAREVIFEISIVLAAHLALALLVGVALLSFGQF
jgi:hypothetical protein